MLQIAKYIQKEFGKKYRDNFIQKVRGSNHIIGNNPDIGKVEPLLADSPFTYQKIVVATSGNQTIIFLAILKNNALVGHAFEIRE